MAKIAAETTDVKSLYVGYAAILALIPAICGFIGMTVIGVSMPIVGTIRTPIAAGPAQLIIGYVLGLGSSIGGHDCQCAGTTTFSGEKSDPGAPVGGSTRSTPVWIAGVLSLIPMLGVLTIIAAVRWSLSSLHCTGTR